ncbi:hypothetical protein SISSUDRAFT_1029510 [Sistotremastrum suecicum HHB10207 ss-3]|uniref:Uncharacterized protein n=1 Tax=Sistotremastrum suecicum HHB10207 ss-3 TaxID=1314776 RepID=A0A166IH08_9AGAM|nr:hypothetical protein SISSUDRAFT_1029510 [Sistotremastrum suecicum HHB10207 ss-3]
MSPRTSSNDSIRLRLESIERELIGMSHLDEAHFHNFQTKWSLLWTDVTSSLDEGRADVNLIETANTVASSIKIISTAYMRFFKECSDMSTRLRQSTQQILSQDNIGCSSSLPAAIQIAAAEYLLTHLHYPTPKKADMMSLAAGYPVDQLSAWFVTARRRLGYSRLSRQYCQGDKKKLCMYIKCVLLGTPSVDIPIEAEKAIQHLRQDAIAIINELRSIPETSTTTPAAQAVSSEEEYNFRPSQSSARLHRLRSTSTQSFDSDATAVSSSRSVSSSFSDATLSELTALGSVSTLSNADDKTSEPAPVRSHHRKRKRGLSPEPEPSPKRYHSLSSRRTGEDHRQYNKRLKAQGSDQEPERRNTAVTSLDQPSSSSLLPVSPKISRAECLEPSPPWGEGELQEITQVFGPDWSVHPHFGLLPESSRLEGEITPNSWIIREPSVSGGLEDFHALFASSNELLEPITVTAQRDGAPDQHSLAWDQNPLIDWFSQLQSEQDARQPEASFSPSDPFSLIPSYTPPFPTTSHPFEVSSPSSSLLTPTITPQVNKRALILAELEKKREELKSLELELVYS